MFAGMYPQEKVLKRANSITVSFEAIVMVFRILQHKCQ